MKINIHVLSFLFTVGLVSAQDLQQQKKITDTYDLQNTRNLQAKFDDSENALQIKIDNYLSQNPKEKLEFFVGEKKYKIVDIIDGKPVYITTDNLSAATAIRVNKLRPGGGMGLTLEGLNMNVGVWDGGWVRTTHTEFLTAAGSNISRVTNPDATTTNPAGDAHGTHVAGTIAARGASVAARGMAPKSSIKSYNWTNDRNEVVSESFNNGLLVSNHSYGVPVLNDQQALNVPSWYMGCYNETAADWDNIAYNYPYYLMVASAGNSGNDNYAGGLAPELDKLTGNKAAKNNLVVANANPTVNNTTSTIISLFINSSSSQGPTDDGRIKPDIAADGTNLYSSISTSNTSYATYTGTSMASPSIAGAVILLQEHYKNVKTNFMKSATLKGLVCHTALDDPQTAGPDPYFGWGMLDAQAAAQTITNSNIGQALILESELSASNPSFTMNFSVSNPANLKATICWTDPVGTVRSGILNDPTPVLVNDLDLRIIKGTQTFFPWKLDLTNIYDLAIKGDNIVDNVEKVEVTSTESGQYTLTVNHKGTLTNGSQSFSLILTGTGVSLNTNSNEFKQISIYPNPTNNILNFNTEDLIEISDISIFDVTGKVISTKYNLNQKTIDVSNLQSGVYFVRFATNGQFINKKFIKL